MKRARNLCLAGLTMVMLLLGSRPIFAICPAAVMVYGDGFRNRSFFKQQVHGILPPSGRCGTPGCTRGPVRRCKVIHVLPASATAPT